MDLRYIGDKYAFIKVLAVSDIVYFKDSLNYYRDPFNKKHTGKFVFYFYEQFLVFDWVYKNMKIADNKKFMEAFYLNTRNSIFREWNGNKLSIYKKLFYLNSRLFFKNLIFNLTEPFKGLFKRNQTR
jgi:hypothetical protein